MTDPMPTPAPPPDQALFDTVTGLPNRRSLMAALRERVPSGSGAVVLMDLDLWRRVVERIQKVQVEEVLRDLTARIRAAAGEGALLFRYGGDSFCVLLPGADRDRGTTVGEALRAALADRPFKFGEAKGVTMVATRLTASLGVAAFPLDGRSPTLLIETVELALMVAKHGGRNRVAAAGSLDPAALAEIGVFRGLPCPVLVGRVEEQQRLRQLASDVRHVGPTLALVTSPPGLGKTRLLRELALWGRSSGSVVLGGTAREPRVSLPYAVLSELLENYLVTDRPAALAVFERLSALHRTALSVVVRDFPAPPLGITLEVSGYGRAIFEAFGAVLDELARTGPVVVSVDEAEHADAATLEVFAAMIVRRTPFFLALATELSELDLARLPLGGFLKMHGPLLHAVILAPLTAEEMRNMLRAILPEAEVAPEALENLTAAAGGNPLHLEETLRSLLLRGKVRPVLGKWKVPALERAELPADLDAAVRAVAAALPARANTLLARAAVLGPSVDPELLQEVLGQDEMEMLDLIDEARRSRLLAASETDLLTFPAAHSRKVRLANAAEDDRKEIHARVGVVQEARFAGDVAHLADELAYHYGKAGNAARAQHFDTVARQRAILIQPPKPAGARRARLDPVKDALGGQALEHAVGLMRSFGGALRVGRLYPKANQVSQTFFEQLSKSTRALFDCGTGLTVMLTMEGPTLNGVRIDAPAIAEFAAFLEERLIESVTFLRNFDPSRFEAIVQSFAEPFTAVTAAANHWDLFLEKREIEGFDIVQRAYQARDRVRKGAVVRGDEPLPPGAMLGLREMMRPLKAAVENVRLYPPGHTLVEETAEQATKAILEFMTVVPAVTLGTAEGDLVVNGGPADKKFLGDIGAFFVKEIDQRALWSISVGQGITGEEVRSLIAFLAAGRDSDASVGDRLLMHMAHVAIGSRQYERATEGEREVELVPPPKPIRSEVRAREYLALTYEQLLTPQFEEAFPVLVEALGYGARRPLAEQLVDRLGEHFHDNSLRHRRQAYDLLARSLAFASPSCRAVQVTRSAPPLKKRLVEDNVPKAFRAAADILPIWVPAAVSAGCLKELADIAGPVLRKRADAEDSPAEIAAAAEGALQLIPGTGAYPVILAAVQKTKQDERMLAVAVLLAIGGHAVQRLVELVVDEPDLAARQSAALAMGLVAGQVAGEFVRALGPDAPVQRFTRFFEVIDSLFTPEISAHLAEMSVQGNPEVRKAVLGAAGALPRTAGVGVVKRLLQEPEGAQRDFGIDLAARLKVDQVSADLGRMLEKADDEHHMRILSRYFAEVPNSAVVPVLVKIASNRSKLFGIVKGYTAETRAAAVKALSKLDTKEAKEAVAQAQGDSSLKELIGESKP